MDHELELTKANRLQVARAFRFNKRVDFSIECAVEGQLGRVYVEERHRQRGVATALCSRLLLDCLALGLRPNWDAANAESVRLARKLG